MLTLSMNLKYHPGRKTVRAHTVGAALKQGSECLFAERPPSAGARASFPISLTRVDRALDHGGTETVAGSLSGAVALAPGYLRLRSTKRGALPARHDRRRGRRDPAAGRQRGGDLAECRGGGAPARGHRESAERSRATRSRGHGDVAELW